MEVDIPLSRTTKPTDGYVYLYEKEIDQAQVIQQNQVLSSTESGSSVVQPKEVKRQQSVKQKNLKRINPNMQKTQNAKVPKQVPKQTMTKKKQQKTEKLEKPKQPEKLEKPKQPQKPVRNQPKQIPVDVSNNPDWLKKKDAVPRKLYSMKKKADCKGKKRQ